MELTIRHFIPGRVRLHVPSLGRRRSLAEASLKWLRARDGIKSARINYDCACLIVEYDVAHEALLRAVIGRLRLMSIAELRSLVVPRISPTMLRPSARAAASTRANRCCGACRSPCPLCLLRWRLAPIPSSGRSICH